MAPEIALLSLSDSPSAFLSALSSTGFLHLSLADNANIPLSQSSVQRAFAISSQLYDKIPLAERARFSRDNDTNFNGHSAVGSTYLNREGGQQKPDWKEGFSYARFPPGESWTQQLPDALEGCRADMEAFSDGCYDLMLKVLDKLSLAFELPEGYFRSCHQHKGANSVTLLNYPPPPPGTSLTQADIRAGAHKDWGSVTLLFQQEGGEPGLEVFLSDGGNQQNGLQLMSDVDLAKGTWCPAPIIPNTVLINLGLMMEAWTSGLCVATLHRVIFPPTPLPKPRRSIAYFGTPDPEVTLKPVQKGRVVDTKHAPKVKDFFEERLKRAEVPKEERKDFGVL